MFRTIVLGLSALFSLNRAVVSNTQNANYNANDRYYISCNNSSLHYNSNSDHWTYTLNRSLAFNVGEDDYFFYDNPGVDSFYSVQTGVFGAWSGADFTLTTTITDDTTLNQSVTYDDGYPYLILQKTFNNATNNALLFDNTGYLFTCDLFGDNDFYYVNYSVYYSAEINTPNDITSYTGTIDIDNNNNSINVPYYNSSTSTPYLMDYQYIVIQLDIYTGQSTNASYNAGYVAGQSDGLESGYYNGYQVGFIDGSNSSTSFVTLLFSIADAPIYYLRSLFNVELFGIKIYSVLFGLITTTIVIWAIKKFI